VEVRVTDCGEDSIDRLNLRLRNAWNFEWSAWNEEGGEDFVGIATEFFELRIAGLVSVGYEVEELKIFLLVGNICESEVFGDLR
jgi:hypothetical protein